MEATAIYPGSIGELVQGNYKGIDVLVSCPINLFTKVRVFESINPISRKQYVKAELFLQNILKQWGYDKYINTLDIDICSQIPRGKGFASSTADLCGTYRALIKLFNREFHETELISNCVRIEPTDSIIFHNATIFDYKKGLHKESIGKYIEFYVLAFEGEKMVSTIEFNKRLLPPLKAIDDIINHLNIGVKESNIKYIAEASSESILRNQHRLNYEILPEVLKFQDKFGALGILGAHSGDMLGMIFDDKEKINKAYEDICHLKGYKKRILKTITI